MTVESQKLVRSVPSPGQFGVGRLKDSPVCVWAGGLVKGGVWG